MKKMWNKTSDFSSKDQSKVSMRLKFYESKSNAANGEIKRTEKPQSADKYFSTTMQTGMNSKQTKDQEPVYAAANKKKALGDPQQAISNGVKRNGNLQTSNRTKERNQHKKAEILGSKNTTHVNTRQVGNGAKYKGIPQKKDQEPNGLYFMMARQPRETKITQESNLSDTKSSNDYTNHKAERPRFLSTDEIGKIYQNKGMSIKRKEKERTNSSNSHHYEVIASTDYQEKIMQSKNALQELRKSLSNDDYLNDHSDTHNRVSKSISNKKSMANGEKTKKQRVSQTAADHEKVTKDSSVSNSSALTKKLLTLTENKIKHSPQNSKKKFSKRFSWRIDSNLDDTDFVSDYVTKPKNIEPVDKELQHNKRHTISMMEYTLADISPASIRSNRSCTGIDARKLQKTKSADFRSARPTKLEIPSLKQRNIDIKQSTSQKSPKSDNNSTSSSLSSLMRGDSKVVFKVDLDAPYHKENEVKRKPEDLVLYREHGIYIPVKARKSKPTEIKDKSLNKWNQTEGPPIRPAKSRTYSTQTGINPCTCCSKRLQARPWNIPEYLESRVTQTNEKSTSEIGTQTHERRIKSQSSQTHTRRFRNSDSQTPAPPKIHHTGVQAVRTVESIEIQTADEDSEIWGTSVSLDRLIRSGAMKRSRSFGHGIRASIEKMRDRSASIDAITDKRNTVSSVSDTSTTPQPQELPEQGSETTGKITTYSWSENGKFVKIFVSYSGIHLIPSKNIAVTTNGINLHLAIVEERAADKSKTTETNTIIAEETPRENTKLTSSLHLHRLRRPVAGLSYNIQRDMITIILRKQKQTPWSSLIFGNKIKHVS